MAFSLSSITRSGAPRPPRMVIYGVEGVGKTTFGAAAPKPIFLPTEDGLDAVKVDSFPLLKSWGELEDAITVLAKEDHDYQNVVLDSADWAETLMCNQVAAEFLVPLDSIRDAYRPDADLTEELDRLAKRFKVSTLVVLRRVFDVGNMSWASYRTAYEAELDRVLGFLEARADGTSGGSFYNTQPVRVSKRFARALITSTLEGRTLYTEAFEMLGFRKQSTFNELATRLGVGR